MTPRSLISLFVGGLCAAALWPASAIAATDVQQASSENWSGYVATSSGSRTFRKVTGSWVQPTASCTSGSGYAAFWVGLGGSGGSSSSSGSAVSSGSGGYAGATSTSGALEQAGTEADCSSTGQATYFAWYELVPAAPVKLGLTVSPGDHITTTVGVSGSTVTIDLVDHTSGQSASRTLTMANPDTSSAEWVAEAPSQCSTGASNCTPLPLTDFGTVKFTGASATASDGHTGTIEDSEWTATQVDLDASAGSGYGPQFASDTSSGGGATPSTLSGGGSAFSVAWSGNAGSSAGSDGGGGGYGYGGGSSGYGSGSGSGYGYGAGDPYGGYGGDGGYGGGYAYVVPANSGYAYVPGGYGY